MAPLPKTTSRRRRVPGGQGIQKRTSERRKSLLKRNTIAYSPQLAEQGETYDYELSSGEDGERFIAPDGQTAILEAKRGAREAKKVSAKEFESLQTDLLKNWVGASPDQPYQVAMKRLKEGVVPEKRVRKRIADYIELKLREVKIFFVKLEEVVNWDLNVAVAVADIIKEVTEQIGVEVEELKRITLVAESIRSENSISSSLLPLHLKAVILAKCRVLKDIVAEWLMDNHDMLGIRHFNGIEKWLHNPTAPFKSHVSDD